MQSIVALLFRPNVFEGKNKHHGNCTMDWGGDENSGLWLNALTPIICLSPSPQSTASRFKKEREGKIKMIVGVWGVVIAYKNVLKTK